jgi:ABC-type Fe3+ transport system substrate-binding protein
MHFSAKHIMSILLAAAVAVTGCSGGGKKSSPRGQANSETLAKIEKRWKKPFDKLPAEKLVIISPHNQSIQNEFNRAFSLQYALDKGKRVECEWRDVGGGGNKILSYLQNVYSRAQSSGIDVVWGGGSDIFNTLRDGGLLQKLTLPQSVLDNIPQTVAGSEFRDAQDYWCGSTVSNFGILANLPLLKRLGRPVPQTFSELGEEKYFGLVALADPTKSSSAAAAYKTMYDASNADGQGWRTVLAICGNAKKFYDSAGGAADAVIAEAPLATVISFYGTMRVSRYPGRLEYISATGMFSADPIAILKNPPHAKIATTFVNFVLSSKGQALLGCHAGTPVGPAEKDLFMAPIRTDFYMSDYYAQFALPGLPNPYLSSALPEKTNAKNIDYNVLKNLIYAAAVTQGDLLKRARKKVIANPSLAGEFYALPENALNPQTIADLQDNVKSEKIMTAWQNYFRVKYEKILE